MGSKLTETNSVVKKRFILKKTEKILMFTKLLSWKTILYRRRRRRRRTRRRRSRRRRRRRRSCLLYTSDAADE